MFNNVLYYLFINVSSYPASVILQEAHSLICFPYIHKHLFNDYSFRLQFILNETTRMILLKYNGNHLTSVFKTLLSFHLTKSRSLSHCNVVCGSTHAGPATSLSPTTLSLINPVPAKSYYFFALKRRQQVLAFAVSSTWYKISRHLPVFAQIIHCQGKIFPDHII